MLQTVNQELARHPTKVTLQSLAQMAGYHGWPVRVEHLDWSQLSQTQCPVVLRVGNDFATIDPRERHTNSAEEVMRVYTWGRSAQWYNRHQLESRWDGQAMVVQPGGPGARGPSIVWPTTLLDFGPVPSNKPETCTFVCRNTGGTPLHISIAGVGCGCTTARVTNEVIEPNKQVGINASLDLHAKRGFFHTSVAVKTDDPLQPVTILSIEGSVYNNRRLSTDKLYFGAVREGEHAVKAFYLYNAGSDRINVSSADFKWESSSTNEFRPKVTVEQLTDISPVLSSDPERLPLRTGDYRVTVSLDVPEVAQTGDMNGTICVEITSNGHKRQVEVPCLVRIISNIILDNPAILLRNNHRGRVSTTISMTSATGRRLVEPAVVLSDAADLALENTTYEAKDVSATPTASFAGCWGR